MSDTDIYRYKKVRGEDIYYSKPHAKLATVKGLVTRYARYNEGAEYIIQKLEAVGHELKWLDLDSIEPGEYVTLPKAEYDALTHDSEFLGCLQHAGVDNWEGYSLAWRFMEGEEDEEDY
jgi:hypothetical protein